MSLINSVLSKTMNYIYYYAILGAAVSLLVALVSILILHRYNRKISGFEKTLENLISPQREYVENKTYSSSNPLVQDPGFLEEANGILFAPVTNNDMIIRTSLPDFSFFEEMGIFLPDVKVDEKMVMCLMPFNRRFEKTKIIIAEACAQAGYEFHRSDDELIKNNTNLRKTIVQMILKAHVIIAVLDGRNPNVFYEIGIAHSVGKLVLMVVNLSRDENKWREVDLLSNRLITYNNPGELKDKLVKTLNAIHANERREEKKDY